MRVRRIFKCPLCGQTYEHPSIVDLPDFMPTQTRETYHILGPSMNESICMGVFCFGEDGHIGYCPFSGFEKVEDTEEKPEV